VSRRPDPDEPTRPLVPGAYEREVPAAPREELLWREELLDRLRSTRTAVVLLGLVAITALGVALWTLLNQDAGNSRRGASVTRVRNLEDRVDRQQREIDRAPSEDDLSEISDDVDALDRRIAKLEAKQSGGASDQALKDVQDEVQQLSDAVRDLDQRVQDLEQQP
jgi:septal ring factor EnvC (AmiA/AmiB activator)